MTRVKIEDLARELLEGTDRGAELPESAELADARDLLESVALAADAGRPSGALRDTLLRSTDPAHRFDGFVRRLAEFFDIEESSARELVASVDAAGEAPWFDDEVEGIRMRLVEAGPATGDAFCLLVRMEPGVSYRPHRHLGEELCLFLGGEARDDAGTWYPGDLVRNPAGSRHEILETRSEDALVFALSIKDGVEFD